MVNVVIAALIAYAVYQAAFGRDQFRKNWSIIKRYRPIHLVTSLPVIALTFIVGNVLTLEIPYFDKNPFLWLASWLFGYGNGNGGANVVATGFQWKWYVVCFLPVFLFAIPSFAEFEEEKFRKGTMNWKNGAVRSVGFGLAHLIALIPIGVAFALTIGGLWFTHQYFKGGTARSTIYHAAYNSILGTFALIMEAVSW